MKIPHYLLAYAFMGTLVICSGTIAEGLRYSSIGNAMAQLGAIIVGVATLLLLLALFKEVRNSKD